jgi:hypothetical protein
MQTKRIVLITLSLAAMGQSLYAGKLDVKVRNDFFSGFSGDSAAMERAMKSSEEVIAAKTDALAEALAWHGGGLLLQAGSKFQQGDMPGGGQLWGRGNAEMEQAGMMAPDDPAVLIPRASVWFASSRQTPPQMAKPILAKAVADYEHVYELQKGYFETLSTHMRSELLFGMADGNARSGNGDKAKVFFEKLAVIGPESGHLEQAKLYLAGEKYQVKGAGCYGCHTGK